MVLLRTASAFVRCNCKQRKGWDTRRTKYNALGNTCSKAWMREGYPRTSNRFFVRGHAKRFTNFSIEYGGSLRNERISFAKYRSMTNWEARCTLQLTNGTTLYHPPCEWLSISRSVLKRHACAPRTRGHVYTYMHKLNNREWNLCWKSKLSSIQAVDDLTPKLNTLNTIEEAVLKVHFEVHKSYRKTYRVTVEKQAC